MFNLHWLTATPTALVMVLISSIGIYLALMLLTRLSGLRSFSKMSSFDFAVTIAFGSIMASTILAKDPSLAIGAFALAVLYGIQYMVSRGRRMTWVVEWLADNQPLVLMVGDRIIEEHLTKARLTEDDLLAKLRMAGITHRRQVRAVVFESTGDVSVLKADDPFDPWLMKGVRGAHHFQSD